MKKKSIRKKIIFTVILIVILIVMFLIGMEYGISKASNQETTVTNISEITVETQTIKKTLTSSGQISSASTEKLELDTSKYFETMCVEEDDIVYEGENILEYTDGTYLTAEYDCVINSFNVPETESICTSSNYVEVQTMEELNMTLSISETEISSVEVGQEVEITLTADETMTYTGEISKIDAVGTYSSSGTTFSAIVTFENDGNIKIGMSASCEVILEEAEDVIAVPIAAVQITDDSRYVIVVNENGETENVEVETGISDDTYVEITSGLNGGETIQLIETTTISNSSSSSSDDSMQGDMMGGGMEMQGDNIGDGMDSNGRRTGKRRRNE